MKKRLTLACAAALTASGTLNAQNPLVLQSPNVDVEYQVASLSPNGKWACGNINDGYYRGFLWNLTTGEFVELSPQGDKTIALSVSNDGTVVGTFMDDDATPNHATVENGGYYKNGKWHHLETEGGSLPTDDTAASQVQAISPNGKLAAGIACVGKNQWAPVVWNLETGKSQTYLYDNPFPEYAGKRGANVGSILGIADNGTAVGWIYGKKANRTPCIWLSATDTILPRLDESGPFSVAGSISPDGTKAVVMNAIYDIPTRTQKQFITWDGLYSYDFYKINDDETIVGYTQKSESELAEAAIIKDGVRYALKEYLEKLGADFSKYPSLLEAEALSNDEKTFSAMAYDENQIPRALIIKLDENTTAPAPVGLSARVLTGAKAVELTWRAPLAGDSAVTGYNVYRDGKKLNSAALTERRFTETGLTDGSTYAYTVKAVYESGESAAPEAATATLSPLAPQAVRKLSATQRGFNNVQLCWDAPDAALPTYAYTDSIQKVYAMGGGNVDFESAVRLRSSLLAAYKGEGKDISDVYFYPMGAGATFKVNFYAADDVATPLYTQTVDGSTLVYGEKNRVKLTTPFAAPEGKDVIVAIEVTLTNGTSASTVMGETFGKCDPGYSDLIRQRGASAEADFYSMYDRMLESEDGSMMYETAFPIYVAFGSASASDASTVTSYAVSEGGKAVAATDGTSLLVKGVTEGTHTYTLAAAYADGSKGAETSATVNVELEASVYEPQNTAVAVDGSAIQATWNSCAADDNRSILTYSSDTQAGGVQGSVMAKTLYSGDDTRTYEGYQIKGVRFYPTGDADFTFYIQQDGETVAEIPVENYTLNRWNEVSLEEPVTVSRNAEYGLILDCYDVAKADKALGMDDQWARRGTSDLYSSDNGQTYTSLADAGGNNANWMMGLVLGTTEGTALPLQGYNVYVDDKKANDALLSDTEFSYDFDTEKTATHKLRVWAVYGGEYGGDYCGEEVSFVINPTSGISSVAADSPLRVSRDVTSIQIEGISVKGMTLYTAAGAVAAKSTTGRLGVSQLPAGSYVLRVTAADGKEYTRKLAF